MVLEGSHRTNVRRMPFYVERGGDTPAWRASPRSPLLRPPSWRWTCEDTGRCARSLVTTRQSFTPRWDLRDLHLPICFDFDCFLCGQMETWKPFRVVWFLGAHPGLPGTRPWATRMNSPRRRSRRTSSARLARTTPRAGRSTCISFILFYFHPPVIQFTHVFFF